MLSLFGSAPPTHLFRGELGPELVVLSTSIVRIAQRLETEAEIETADGVVKGRKGDFVVTAAGGERYPIPAEVFFGTYEVLGNVGSRFVGRRLLHARRAWPIESAHAEFDYGPGRGRVAAPRGGWIYRSDEEDYGLINAEAKSKAHIVVGEATELEHANWEMRFRHGTLLSVILPPVLTLIALLAYSSALRLEYVAAEALLVIEGICLILGIAAIWWIRRDRWVLKAALIRSTKFALTFQCAVGLLGQRESEIFPSMALWRAAQHDWPTVLSTSSDSIRNLKNQVYTVYDQVRHEVDTHNAAEKFAEKLAWVAALAVVGCIGYAVGSHSLFSELTAIWLPSAVGGVHALFWRRQLSRRINAGQEFLAELAFVRSQLVALLPEDKIDPKDAPAKEALRATLRVLCRAVAEHAQRQLQFALGEVPAIPV
jgi:hypothetical protein